MNLTQREGQLLAAMALATPDEARRLTAELDAIRAQRRASIEAGRSLDLSNRVVAAHLTPAQTHVKHSSETDWLHTIAPDSDPREAHQSLKAKATQWFRSLSAAVRADEHEFRTQAEGMAAHYAGQYGMAAGEAKHAFVAQAMHLGGYRKAKKRAGYGRGSAGDSDEASRGGKDMGNGVGYICPHCDFNGSRTEVAHHVFEQHEGRQATAAGTVLDDIEPNEGGDIYTVTEVWDNQGTIIRFKGTDESGAEYIIAADHRMAYPIMDALNAGETPEVSAPGYMVQKIGSKTAAHEQRFGPPGSGKDEKQMATDEEDIDINTNPFGINPETGRPTIRVRRSSRTAEWAGGKCDHCGKNNVADAYRCNHCGGVLPGPRAKKQSAEKRKGNPSYCSCGFATHNADEWHNHIFNGPNSKTLREGHERMYPTTSSWHMVNTETGDVGGQEYDTKELAEGSHWGEDFKAEYVTDKTAMRRRTAGLTCPTCGEPVEPTPSFGMYRHVNSLTGPCGIRLMDSAQREDGSYTDDEDYEDYDGTTASMRRRADQGFGPSADSQSGHAESDLDDVTVAADEDTNLGWIDDGEGSLLDDEGRYGSRRNPAHDALMSMTLDEEIAYRRHRNTSADADRLSPQDFLKKHRKQAGYGQKAWDIVGYTYKAENYTPAGVIEAMIQNGDASPAARDMDVEDALDQIAEANAIDRQDEYSFDTDEFPKVIFSSDAEGEFVDEGGNYVTASLKRRASLTPGATGDWVVAVADASDNPDWQFGPYTSEEEANEMRAQFSEKWGAPGGFIVKKVGFRRQADQELFSAATDAYNKDDWGWFNSLGMDDLLTLWRAVSGENFATGVQTYAWDDEVYDALANKGYDFSRTAAFRRRADQGFGPDADSQSGHAESQLDWVDVSDDEDTNLGWIDPAGADEMAPEDELGPFDAKRKTAGIQNKEYVNDDESGLQWTGKCEQCGAKVEYYRGQGDFDCDRCGACYNASGQRLRDDWRDNPSNYDDDISDMEGYEMGQARKESYGSRKTAAFYVVEPNNADVMAGPFDTREEAEANIAESAPGQGFYVEESDELDSLEGHYPTADDLSFESSLHTASDDMSVEARELALFIENDEPLYRQQYTPIVKNLERKRAKGVYDHELAIKGMMYLVDEGARKYNTEFGSGSGVGGFTPAIRREVAEYLVGYLEDEWEIGNSVVASLMAFAAEQNLECYGCGKKGTNDDFGFGRDRKCPDCGSSEVHSPDAHDNWKQSFHRQADEGFAGNLDGTKPAGAAPMVEVSDDEFMFDPDEIEDEGSLSADTETVNDDDLFN